MKLASILLTLCFSLSAFAQSDQELRLEMVQNGLSIIQDKHFNLITGFGYTIKDETEYRQLDRSSVSTFRRKNDIPEKAKGIQYQIGSYTCTVFRHSIEMKMGMKQHKSYFLVDRFGRETRKLSMLTYGIADTVLEAEIAFIILQNRIPKSNQIDPSKTDEFRFVGRAIKLGTPCGFKSGNYVYCTSLGSIQWWEFQSMESAKAFIDYKALHVQDVIGVQEFIQDTIEVLFEGVETIAVRQKTDMVPPQTAELRITPLGLVLDFSEKKESVLSKRSAPNHKIIYYVIAEIRGTIVAAELAHYTQDPITDKGFPELISQVLSVHAH